MTIDEIKELIQVVKETGIAELMVQRGEDIVKIVGTVASPAPMVPVPTVVPIVSTATSSLPPSAALASSQTGNPVSRTTVTALESSEEEILVKSPIVGTYYDAPSPDAPKFVKVGDHVEPKQVLCIIESMKLMNEIEAETAGILVSKFIENGRPVEYGESLFSIRPVK